MEIWMWKQRNYKVMDGLLGEWFFVLIVNFNRHRMVYWRSYGNSWEIRWHMENSQFRGWRCAGLYLQVHRYVLYWLHWWALFSVTELSICQQSIQLTMPESVVTPGTYYQKWRRHVIGSLEIFLLTVQETIFVICWACVRTLPLRVSSCTKFVGSLHLPQTLLQGLRVGWLRGRNRSRRRGESNSVRLQTVWGLMNCGSQRRVKLPFLQLHCCQALVRSRLVWFCHPYTTMTKVRP